VRGNFECGDACALAGNAEKLNMHNASGLRVMIA